MTALSHHSRIGAIVVFLLLGWQTSTFAQQLTTLQIFASDDGSEPVLLELSDLDALEQHSFTTTTIWTDGDITFSGVPLKVLLEETGVTGSAVEMVALNDYKATILFSDLETQVPLVATRMNGSAMSVREKGPYWVVFPYDQDAKYRTEEAFGLSIWQLNRMNIIK